MNKTIFSLLIILAWVSFSICSNAWALKIKRISAKVLDLGKVNKVYISAGLASVIIFPKPIIEVKLGNPDLIKTTISKTLPNELTLIINKDLRSPSNIIVRSGSRNFIFDVFPSQTMHQDLIEVMASYGALNMMKPN